MLGCLCWGSENVPIMKDALGKQNIPILRFSAHLIPILWYIKLKCVIHNPSLFFVDYSSFSPLLHVIIYNTQHKLPPTLSDAANFTPILSEIFSLVSLPWRWKRTHVLHFWTHTSGHSCNLVVPPPPPLLGVCTNNRWRI